MNHLYLLAAAAMTCFAASANPVLLDSHQAQNRLTQERENMKIVDALDANLITPLALPAREAGETAVTQAPGEQKYFEREAYAYYTSFGSTGVGSTSNYVSIISMDGDDVYIQDPIYELPLGSYIKGTKNGNTITCQFPQYIGNLGDEPVYVNRFNLDWSNPEEQKVMYYMATENNTITYTLNDDGTISMEESEIFGPGVIDMPKFILGANTTDGNWAGFGEFWTIFTQTNDVATMRPADVTFEDCQMRYTIVGGLEPVAGRVVKIGIDGDKFYLSNIHEDYPDACIVGTLQDGKVSFPKLQYLGVCKEYKSKSWFWPIQLEWGFDDYFQTYAWLPKDQNEMVCEYDAATKTLSTDQGFYINLRNNELWYTELFNQLTVKPVREAKDAAPENPIFWQVMTYEPAPYDYAFCSFAIPMFNVEDCLMNMENVYFNLYFGQEKYVFSPENFESITEATTDIPYFYNDSYQIKSNGIQHFVYFDSMPTIDMNKVGLQVSCKGTDGNIYSSDIVYYKPEAGVEDIFSEAADAQTLYTTLSGVRVSNPENGIFLKTTVKTDGTRRTEKIVIR